VILFPKKNNTNNNNLPRQMLGCLLC
jgi:hypothetical protein